MTGGRELLEKLKNDSKLTANKSANQGLEDMSLLFNYIEALDADANVRLMQTLSDGRFRSIFR